jgi:hypothetical protein
MPSYQRREEVSRKMGFVRRGLRKERRTNSRDPSKGGRGSTTGRGGGVG